MFDIIDMPWDWPVEVNYLEAKAFCRWKQAQEQGGPQYRVVTEAEHHRLRGEGPDDGEPSTGRAGNEADPAMRREAPGNINLRCAAQQPARPRAHLCRPPHIRRRRLLPGMGRARP